MYSVKKGIFFVITSAFIFGATPILTRITYDEGTNGVTMTFLRCVLAAPFLFVMMKFHKIPLIVSWPEARSLLTGGLASSVTVIMMYSSYSYIPVGEAVTLHFIYPSLVSLGCVLFYGEKLTKTILAALLLSVAGVFMFSDNMSFNDMGNDVLKGFLLALTSGFTFAYYLVQVDKSPLRRVPATKISFALCVIGAFCSGIYGVSGYAAGGLAFGLSLKGWIYALAVALSVSAVAMGLLQLGIKHTGATTAAILSTFEPITSVLCGVLFLGETLSLPKAVGCVLVIASVILVTVAGNRTQ